MDSVDEDLDDSALICKSLIPKRKAFQNINPKNSKQIKLDITESSKKTVSKKITSQNDSKWGESSSYFSKKQNTCPLCLKAFKSDSAYSAHMKQCAKTHKMTTQQLLEALELQKKQMRERRALGLCSQSLPSPKTTVSKKKTENKLESYDLALGLALSKSLTTCESKTGMSQESTLEEFGFTSKSTVLNRKKGNDKKLVLKERTAEERQRIIVEKVAVVLLDDPDGAISDDKVKQNSSQNSQIPQLWNLGENNEKHDWYVTGIKPLVLSDVENTPEKTPPPTPPPLENIDNKISELNLPQNEFNESWKKMINCSVKSDLIARTKDNQDLYLHSLVLFTRCPEILEKDFESTFQKFNLSTILVFLEYLYCGTLNSLIGSEVNNLFDLASEINFKELVLVLDCLKNKLKEDLEVQKPQELNDNVNKTQKNVDENGKLKSFEDKDLFSEDNVVNLTDEGDSNESNAEKSYWSFIQHEKRKQNLVEKHTNEIKDLETIECGINSKTTTKSEESKSATGDLVGDAKTSSDCITLSSGSEPQQGPSTPQVDYEVLHFDPYDHLFAEEPFSPVGLNSQSLLMGDISTGSLKLSSPAPESDKKMNDTGEQKKIGYCSTPVTAHHSRKIKSSSKGKYKKRRSDLSSNRILRKSLGLKNKTPRKSIKKKGNEIVEALANSVLHELSKSSIFQRKNFVEITPLASREQIRECVTPSPNYSIMGESVIKEQLTKYGLKKNLAKSKAKKILRHIFEELHPLYNTETGKIVKKVPSNTPKTKSKSKKATTKNKKSKPAEKIANLNSSTESQNMSDETMCPNKSNSDGSDFEDLNETLTQSLPSNPVDLPSAFSEFLQNNPGYHQKILLYEPIWLEELQKSLKETFKKHFKMSDIRDYLDQECVTFRSVAQAKKLQKRNQEKKTSKKRSPS